MQMYKVIEAKRIYKGFQCLNFRRLIEFLKQMVAPSIRASYNMYLEITYDSLACIMAVDGLFLFYLLCCYGVKKEALSESSFLSQMVDSSGRRLAQDMTLREAMMLENQIPIHVLKTILVIESSEIEIVSKVFLEILMGFCQFVSPFDIMADYPHEEEELQLLGELFKKVESKIPVPKPATNSRVEKEELLFAPKKSSRSTTVKIKKIVEQFINIAKDVAPLPLKNPLNSYKVYVACHGQNLGRVYLLP
ncbi:hypothetical protein TorRG33x02_300140 [Trema orientale]|uniref:Uncharacterized protein n=1 Tax=Trema orientale TaxID=63057 RepID=A0A2P5C2G0_TREOI|nr:hypothetical protein TorRG33x02_300140 [Trema orientale]